MTEFSRSMHYELEVIASDMFERFDDLRAERGLTYGEMKDAVYSYFGRRLGDEYKEWIDSYV